MKKLITSLIVCILVLVISSCAAPYEDGYTRFTYYLLLIKLEKNVVMFIIVLFYNYHLYVNKKSLYL